MSTRSILPLVILSAAAATAFGQGSLTPPAGAPAPVYKTLDQVEARTPLVNGQPGVTIDAGGTVKITAPGSYYLTGNRTTLTYGVFIDSSDVTVDLNGFTISPQASAVGGSGIYIGGIPSGPRRNIVVKNGNIHGNVTLSSNVFSGTTFDYGVSYSNNPPQNVVLSGLTITGCELDGIDLGSATDSTIVENCTVQVVGRHGIRANVVRDSAVGDCGGTGIDAGTVSNSSARSITGIGIKATTVQNSTALGLTKGIAATAAVTNSYGESGTGPGIEVTGTASFCRVKSGTPTAMTATIAIGCTTAGGLIDAPQKHLGTP